MNTNTNALNELLAMEVEATEVEGMFGEAVTTTENTNTEMEMVNMTTNTNTEVVANENTNTTEGVVTMENTNKLGLQVEAGVVNMKHTYVLKAQQVVKAVNGLLDYTQIAAQAFTLGERGATVAKVVGVTNFFAQLEEAGVTELATGAGTKKVKLGTNAVIVIEGMSGYGRREIKKASKRGAFLNEKLELIVPSVQLDKSVVYVNSITGEQTETTEGLTRYVMVGGSAAAIRKGSFTMIREDLVEALEVLQDDTYAGGYSMNLKDAEKNRRKFANDGGRMAHRYTTQVAIGNLVNIAIFTGEFMDGGSDGTSYELADKVATMLTEKLSATSGRDIVVTPEAVMGMSIQARPVSEKAQGSIKSKAAMNLMLKTLIKSGVNVVTVKKSDMTPESSQALFSLENTLIVVTEDGKFELGKTDIEWLTDDNALKLSFDLSQDVPLFVLKAIKSTGSANLNGQVYSKIMHSARGVEYIKKTAQKNVDNFFNNLEEAIASGEGFVSEEKLASSDVNGVIKNLFKGEVLNAFPNLKKRVLQDNWKELAKMLSNLKLEVEGDYLTAEGDPSKMYGLKSDLLAINEVFINDRALLETTKEAVVIKYPSVHNREYLLASFVSHDELKARIKARVAAGEITKEEGNIIKNDFFSQSKAKFMVSTNATLKQLLAGFDMDTDAAMFFYDQELVSIIKEESKELAVIIEGLKGKDKTLYSTNIRNNGQLVINNLEGTGMGIGVITHISEVFSSLLALPAINVDTDGKLTPYKNENKLAVKFLKAFFIESSASVDYTALRRGEKDGFDTLYVNEEEAIRVVKSLEKEVAITESNYKVIIEDLMAIARYVQETEIDFAKTGVSTKVTIALNVQGKEVKSAFHKKLIDAGVDTDGKLFYTQYKNENKLYVPSVLDKIRVEMLESAKARLQVQLDEVTENGFEDSVSEFLEATMTKHPMLQSFRSWKNMYNDIQGEYVASVRDSIDEETGDFMKISDDEMEFARSIRKQKLQALINTIRKATMHMTLVERGRAMMAMSVTDSKGDIRTNLGTAFYSIMPLELFAFLNDVSIQLTGSNGVVGTPITVINERNVTTDAEGNEVAKVSNGSVIVFDEYGNPDTDAVMYNTELAGKYHVREINDKFVAVKSIASVIKEIEEKEVKASTVDSFAISVNYLEGKDEIFNTLKDEKEVIVVSSRETGDYLLKADGTPVAAITMPNGNSGSDLSKLLHGKLFNIDSLDLRKDGNYESLLLVVSGGTVVTAAFARPKSKFVTNKGQAAFSKRNDSARFQDVKVVDVEEAYQDLEVLGMFE